MTYDFDYEQYGNVGTYVITPKGLTSGNYEITYADGALQVEKKAVTVSGIKAVSKDYDGTAEATLDYSETVLNGVLEQDLEVVSVKAVGEFDNAEPGTGKNVAIGELTLEGDGSGNYILAESGQQTETTADINDTTATSAEVVFGGSLTDKDVTALTSVTAVRSSNVEAYAKTLQEKCKEVKAELEVIPRKESEISKEAVEEIRKIAEKAYGSTAGEKIKTEYLEIDLIKYVDGTKAGLIADTGTPLEIEFSVDTSKMYDPIVVRTHGGVTKALERLNAKPSENFKDGTYYVDNGKIYVYSQYFSDFALVYATEPVEKTVTVKKTVAKTGDYTATTAGWLFAMMTLAGGCVILGRRKRL